MKRPVLYVVIPFCLGIALARFFKIPIAYPIILSTALIALALLIISRAGLNLPYLSTADRNIFSHISLYLAIFFFGMAAYQNSIILPADHISRYIQDGPQRVLVRGMVADDPITNPALYGKRKKTVFTLKADAIQNVSVWKKVSGLMKVTAYSDKGIPVAFGDELILEGILAKPHSLKNPGIFDYEEYLAIKDIYAVLRVKEDFLIKKINDGRAGLNPLYHMSHVWNAVQKAAYKLRSAIRELFDKHLEEPYSGFMNAIMIGDRSDLDDELKEDFMKTGTIHILPCQYTKMPPATLSNHLTL